jgi:H+/Na+-translocating ferredoxin:NAD+ oxidoreductase subunit D
LMANSKFMATVSPHLHEKGQTIDRAMRDVLFALTPAAIWAIIVFGFQALLVFLVSIVTAMITELVMRFILGRKATLGDLSAVLTGLFLAFLLPVSTPLWVVAIGSFLAVGVGKELFGGLGKNIFNPALFGRVALMISPLYIYTTKFVKPFWWKGIGFFTLIQTHIDNGAAGRVVYKSLTGKTVNTVTSATPLSLLKSGKMLADTVAGPTPVGATWLTSTGRPSFWSMTLGLKAGCLGEVSVILLLLGGIYLIYRKTIDWRIPVGVLAGALFIFLVTWNHPLYMMVSGGLWLGAFYMATDWVSSPMTRRGKWIYAVGIGVFIGLVRLYSPWPEGVAISILIWNVLTLLIDRYVAEPKFGEIKKPWFNKVPVYPKARAAEEKT